MHETEEKEEGGANGARQQPRPKLDWKDYFAFTAAALQTIALPFILIAVLVFLLAILFTWLPV